MSLLYIFTFSKVETQQVARLMGATVNGNPPARVGPSRVGLNDIVLFASDMGPKIARSLANSVLNHGTQTQGHESGNPKPDAILVIGLCGGLTANLRQNTIVTYKECRSTDANGTAYTCSPSLTECLSRVVNSTGTPCESVVGITSPRIATTKEIRLELARSGAQAVDMESYEILAAAHETGVPVAVLRVVADHMDMRLPDLNRALNEAGSLDQRKALRVAIGSPMLTARLVSANKRAMRHLGKALEIVLPSDCFADARIANGEVSSKTAPRG
jgi:nucleoside phosphorylase